MKFLFFLEFVFLFNAIKGNESPFLTVPREQEIAQPLMMGKTIIISGKNGQINTEDPNVMQAVMNAVNNQFKTDSNNGKDVNGNDIPEVIITDSDPQLSQQSMSSPMESVEKIYSLPAVTRMIASEEETDSKKTPFWRSPLPILHTEECPHHKHHRKSKSSRKKGRKHHKTAPTEPTTTTHKPIVEDNEKSEPLSSFLSSIISNSVFPSESERQVNEMKAPSSFLMSISRRVRPQTIELPFLPRAKPRGFIAILHKRGEPLKLPVPETEPQMMTPFASPAPLFNPFLDLLSKFKEPMEPKMNFNSNIESEPKDSTEGKGTNFNFNVNLTINNFNYPQPEDKDFMRPPFPLLFN